MGTFHKIMGYLVEHKSVLVVGMAACVVWAGVNVATRKK